MNYVLIYKDTKELAGIDHGSGGYPFRTHNLNIAYFWTNKAEALNHVRMFPELELKEFYWELKCLQ